ncbi:hypothetical protein WAK64_08325 [Bacillus spongiae]|uniref:Helix-turn-helix domain-containing protein n=1 Tax=Bacillus spongiae TaxID=2683610 RepID=A0ABU8HCZ9_9BACI
MHLKSGSINQFKQFSQFSSLTLFNHHIEMWLAHHHKLFSKGELVALKRLVRFSAKVPGVSNAKIATVLKAIHDEYNGNGISRSTFKRMITKAIQVGIITVHETERKNGSQSSNLYVFNCFPKSELPKTKKLNHQYKTNNLSKTKLKKENKRNTTELDYTYTNEQVPLPFLNLVKYFFSEAKMIEEFWRMTKIAAYRNNREKEMDKLLPIAIHSFKQMIRKLKSNRKIRNPIAYYYRIVEKKLEILYFEELYELGF